ncbi:hypothetical protein CUMW_047930 [Citrus unshiu]|nr:hypothetical protein CUMW_047930 [Citrus unshiu]
MAQITSQGGLNLLFNGDGSSFGVEPRDPFQYKLGSGLRSIEVHKRKLITPRNGVWSSMNKKKSSKFSVDASLNVSGKGISGESEEYDSDEEPVNVVCWKRAICLEFMEKADVLEYYDQTINSPNGSFYIPAVLRVRHLLQVVKRRRIKNNLSRKNLMYRDNFTCQYCSSRENLTIDHVVPASRGGEWKWENLVAACFKCNSRKGKKTLEEAHMQLLRVPKAPKDYDILAIPLTSAAIRMLRVRKGTPVEWRQYLPQHSLEL